jgi:hypothetical protein
VTRPDSPWKPRQRYEEAVPLDQLTPHPANPNEGDVGLVDELVTVNGFAGAILAQASTGIIIDGETRWRAAVAEGAGTIPVLWADVDDETRDRLLASINEATRKGRNNLAKLVALLQPFTDTPDGLAGTAFDGDDLDDLIAQLNRGGEEEDDKTGSPPPDKWGVIVECKTEEQQERLIRELDSQGFSVRALG